MKKILFFSIMAMSLVACNQSNPLLEQPNTPFGVPAFDQIKLEHYLPAFEKAMETVSPVVDKVSEKVEEFFDDRKKAEPAYFDDDDEIEE